MTERCAAMRKAGSPACDNRPACPCFTAGAQPPVPGRRVGKPQPGPLGLSWLPPGQHPTEAGQTWGSERPFPALTNRRHCGENLHIFAPPRGTQDWGRLGCKQAPLPKEWAAVVSELKKRPRPRSPSFTTPVAVMNTLAGLMSAGEEKGPGWGRRDGTGWGGGQGLGGGVRPSGAPSPWAGAAPCHARSPSAQHSASRAADTGGYRWNE